MDERQTIYPHQAIKLLRRLRNDSPLLSTKNDDYLADVLGITKDAMLRCLTAEDKGSKAPYRGWPNSRGFDVARTVDEALLELAGNYLGPKAFASELAEGLASLGIDPRELIGSMDLYEQGWGGKRSYDVEELRRLCDSVASHCAERNGVEPAKPNQAATKSGRLRPIAALLRGGKARGEVAGIGTVDFDFGEGAVSPLLPAKDDELLAALLPREAPAPPCGEEQARELARWLDEDGGRHFSSTISRCRELLPACCDGELLLRRVEALFETVAAAGGGAGALGTLSYVRRFAGDDPARALAAVALALVMGPANCHTINGVLRGRWTR